MTKPMNFTRVFAIGIVVLVAVAIGATLLEKPTPAARPAKPAAPPVALSGNEAYAVMNSVQFTATLKQHTGKVVVVTFWGTWCGPCRMELPHLIKLHHDHKSDDLVMLSVADDVTDAETLRAYESAVAADIPYPVYYDADLTIQRAYKVRSLPCMIIFNRQGRQAQRYDGYYHGMEDEVEELVTKLLKEN